MKGPLISSESTTVSAEISVPGAQGEKESA